MAYLRRLPKFEYIGPGTLAEACSLYAGAADGEVLLLAGGTDALLQMRRRERVPRRVLGLKAVAELDFVREQADGGLAFGAMTTLATLQSSPAVRQRYRFLAEAAGQIGGCELRNVATVGGNIAGALPCADLPPALMTLGARVRLSSSRGHRWVPIDEFYPAFGRSAAARDELVSEISLPPAAACSAGTYLKFHDRQSMDMTVVGVSAYVDWDCEREVIRDLRLAFASGAPTVFRARKAESVLRGAKPTEAAIEEAAATACGESSPRTSWRANGAYRLELIRNLTRRAIRCAWQKAATHKGGES